MARVIQPGTIATLKARLAAAIVAEGSLSTQGLVGPAGEVQITVTFDRATAANNIIAQILDDLITLATAAGNAGMVTALQNAKTAAGVS